MNKFLFIIILLAFNNFKSQDFKLTVLDEENKPIIGAKIESNNTIFYTNDDGQVSLDIKLKTAKVSTPTYEEKEIFLPISEVRLAPIYKNIDEVILNKIDVKTLFSDLLKNYLNVYYSQPSYYDAVIKQKGYMNGKLINMLVADFGLWSKFNIYNFNDKKSDNFIQIKLDQVKHFKTIRLDKDYPFKTDIQVVPENFVQKLFLNAEITGILNDCKNPIISKLKNNTAGIQKIEFETQNEENINYSGYFIYNKNDKAITYFEVIGKLAKNNIRKEKNSRGEEYDIISDTFKLAYDFVKRENKYIPTKTNTYIKGFGVYKGEKFPMSFVQEINLQKFKMTNNKGLKNKIDLTKSLTENIPTTEEAVN
jgi:hypothetical protein